MKRLSVPETDLLKPGHTGCQGCGATLSMRLALKGLGEKTVIVIPACCWTILAGASPRATLGVNVLHSPFAAAAATASGVKAGLLSRGDAETMVMAWAGDGGTFDIGLQSLSGAADRNEDFLYVCYDNEAYMNTGIQRSGATPQGAWTMTTPSAAGSERPKKDLDAILEAHHIPYIATASPAFAEDLVRKFQKARGIRGFRFIRVLAPCPPGWKYNSEDTIKLAKLSVQTGVFPLYEIEEGKFRMNMPAPTAKRKPVAEFLNAQGRFRRLDQAGKDSIQAGVDARFELLASRK